MLPQEQQAGLITATDGEGSRPADATNGVESHLDSFFSGRWTREDVLLLANLVQVVALLLLLMEVSNR